MLKFALTPANNDSALIEQLHWHMCALKTHNISYGIIESPGPNELAAADIILCTDISFGQILPARYHKKIVYIDPLMSPDIAGALNRAILEFLPKQKVADTYESMFSNWVSSNDNPEITQVFAPGPSGRLTKIKTNALSLITGHSKIEEALAGDIHIDGIIISDSLALANPTSHARELVSSIQALQRRYGSMLITTLANAAILSPHWPKNLLPLLIGVPENFRSISYATLASQFHSFPSGNVLTALVLPTALAFKKPLELYGFDGLLKTDTDTSTLAHYNKKAQEKTKLDIFKYSYGSGLIFPDEYQNKMQLDTAIHIAKYKQQGHIITAQEALILPSPSSVKLGPRLKGMLYASTAYADNNKLLAAVITTALSAFMAYIGIIILGNSNTLLYTTAIASMLLILLGFLHLRARAKRLSELAERRATEKAHRAFEATNKRLDELEKKLGSK